VQGRLCCATFTPLASWLAPLVDDTKFFGLLHNVHIALHNNVAVKINEVESAECVLPLLAVLCFAQHYMLVGKQAVDALQQSAL